MVTVVARDRIGTTSVYCNRCTVYARIPCIGLRARCCQRRRFAFTKICSSADGDLHRPTRRGERHLFAVCRACAIDGVWTNVVGCVRSESCHRAGKGTDTNAIAGMAVRKSRTARRTPTDTAGRHTRTAVGGHLTSGGCRSGVHISNIARGGQCRHYSITARAA